MQTVRQWLEQLGLPQYAEVFERNAVDVNLAKDLTQQDLRDLGIELLGHRKVLLRGIAQLNETQASTTTVQAVKDQPPPKPFPSVEAERRQLTVMFCDLVGSTELAARLDPEQLRDLMQAYQRSCRVVIERYEGHIAQYLGDGLMVYFGWPHAHEDDAVRAIRAGLEVVEAVSKLSSATPIRARAGIHTGLVVVGETGQGDASIPKAAVGQTPNIAARLQALAEPDCVLVSERTESLARGLFHYVDQGTPALKGVSEVLRVFRVGGARAIDSRFDAARTDVALTPLVGREEEVALLLRRWREAEEGEGQVVLVGGEPGIGKSRLTLALRERLQNKPYTVLRYQCSPYHVNSALYPVIDQLERAAGFAREDTPEEKLEKLLAVLVGNAASVAESAPLFAAMLSLPVACFPPLNLSPQKQKERTLEALAGQVEALAKRQPVLMIYEDAHWIDATSQEALDLLVQRLHGLPILLLITYRPEYTPRWSEQAHVTMLGLNRLGRRQGAELVTKLTSGKGLPEELQEQILAHTDGVPLFVEELTKSILESRLLRDVGARYVLDGPLPALAIPTTLRDSLIARLDRLAPIREVAQIGACIGREFPYDLVSAVSPVKGAKLDEALERLTASGLLFRRGMPPDATYTFKHALVQDAAYDSLLKTKRAELHVRIAQLLEQGSPEHVTKQPDVLAYHFMQAGLHERAATYWTHAGERSLGRMALTEAVGHLTNALLVNEQTAPSRERDERELNARLLLANAQSAFFGWGAVQVIETLKPARDLAIRLDATDQLFRILDHYHTYYLQRCDFPTVLRINEEVASLARSRADSGAAVIALLDECITEHAMGNFGRARRAMDRMLQVYDATQHAGLVLTFSYDPKCLALSSAGYVLYALGFPDQARQAALEGLDTARRLGHAFNLCWNLTGGTHALLMRGETHLALQWVAEAHDIASEHGLKYVLDVSAPSWGGHALVEEGNYAEGYTRITTGQKVWRDAGCIMFVPLDNTARARALIGLKRFEEARDLLDEALAVIEQTDQRADESEVYRVRGNLLCYYDSQLAEASYRKALEVARSQDAKGLELRAAVNLASLWQSRDQRHEAYDLLAPIFNWFTEGFDTKDLRQAKALLDELG